MMLGILLPLLLTTFALAVGSLAWVVLTKKQRETVLRRALGTSEPVVSAIMPVSRSPLSELVEWLAARLPAYAPAQQDEKALGVGRLEQAGFNSPQAPVIFIIARIASVVICGGLALLLAPASDPMMRGVTLVVGFGVGFLAPTMALDNKIKARQTAIRRAIPDALDLLVVCVEAGIALDASMQRVSRELLALHPLLAEELVAMGRRMSAGMPRDQAMHSLYLRTGVDELRALSSHMLQSEKWGTSIVTVLRMFSEQLRHKRQITAEKRAATASTRMMLPLALFIFPTLFVVLLGPAVMRLANNF